MRQHTVEIEQSFNRPVEQIFAVVSDHNQLGRVLGVPVRRIHDGESEVNGVGSIRRVGFGPLALEESVTAMTENRSIDYRITRGGGPIRNHAGRLRFEPRDNGGSVLRWTIRFESAWPLVGSLVAVVLDRGLRMGLTRLA